jgi:hypothetical protein
MRLHSFAMQAVAAKCSSAAGAFCRFLLPGLELSSFSQKTVRLQKDAGA